jgi:hypothetical protein
MQFEEYRDAIKALVVKSFLRCGKSEKDIDQIRILVDDIIAEKITLEKLEMALNKHARKSPYVPQIANIIEILEHDEQLKKEEFKKLFLSEINNYFGVIKDDRIRYIANKIGKHRIKTKPSESILEEAYKLSVELSESNLLQSSTKALGK